MSDIFKLTGDSSGDTQAMQEVIDAVKSGQLAVIPTDTSYALIADAFHVGAIALLRMAKKQTPDIPVPVGASSFEMANGIANFSNLARDITNAFWPGPLTLLVRGHSSISWPIGDLRTALSIRVPHSKYTEQIITATGPVAMTGAQQSGDPSIQIVEHSIATLGDKVAVYLDAGELPENKSSIVDATTDNLRLLRQGQITLEQLRAINPSVIDATR